MFERSKDMSDYDEYAQKGYIENVGEKTLKAVAEPVILVVTGQPVGAVVETVLAPVKIVGALLGFGRDDDD